MREDPRAGNDELPGTDFRRRLWSQEVVVAVCWIVIGVLVASALIAVMAHYGLRGMWAFGVACGLVPVFFSFQALATNYRIRVTSDEVELRSWPGRAQSFAPGDAELELLPAKFAFLSGKSVIGSLVYVFVCSGFIRRSIGDAYSMYAVLGLTVVVAALVLLLALWVAGSIRYYLQVGPRGGMPFEVPVGSFERPDELLAELRRLVQESDSSEPPAAFDACRSAP